MSWNRPKSYRKFSCKIGVFNWRTPQNRTPRWRLNLCGLEPHLIKLEFIIYLAKLKVINHPKVEQRWFVWLIINGGCDIKWGPFLLTDEFIYFQELNECFCIESAANRATSSTSNGLFLLPGRAPIFVAAYLSVVLLVIEAHIYSSGPFICPSGRSSFSFLTVICVVGHVFVCLIHLFRASFT